VLQPSKKTRLASRHINSRLREWFLCEAIA
jgi:hypothetical protein